MDKKDLFLVRAQNAGWDQRRIQAYVYANEAKGLKFPDASWKPADLQQASEYSLNLLDEKEEGELARQKWRREHPIACFMVSFIATFVGTGVGILLGLADIILKGEKK